MASSAIQQLLQPPSAANSQQRALDYLNARFQTWEQLEEEGALERVVDDARREKDELCVEVSE